MDLNAKTDSSKNSIKSLFLFGAFMVPLVWNQDVVDSSQFDVDLEAEV